MPERLPQRTWSGHIHRAPVMEGQRSCWGPRDGLAGINRVPGLIRNCGGDLGDTPTSLPLHDVTCSDDSELVAFTSQFGPNTPSGAGREIVMNSRHVVSSVSVTRGRGLAAGSTSL